jgi:nicotinamidase-related amidase
VEVSAQQPTIIEAKPEPITVNCAETAVIVVDMQNDFCSKGGLFDRAGINISAVQKAVRPTWKVLSAAREAGITIIYLKMASGLTCQTLETPILLTGCVISDSVSASRASLLMVGRDDS